MFLYLFIETVAAAATVDVDVEEVTPVEDFVELHA